MDITLVVLVQQNALLPITSCGLLSLLCVAMLHFPLCDTFQYEANSYAIRRLRGTLAPGSDG